MTAYRLLLLGIASVLLAFANSSCVTTSNLASSGRGSQNDDARYLAGLDGANRGELALSRSSGEWRSHKAQMDGLWSAHGSRRSHIRGFRSELKGLGSGVLFYPFGGPDYLHANALFPGARTYVLVGLEGVDAMPDLSSLSAGELRQGLAGIAASLRTVTGSSYFITKDMRVDLQRTRFRGTLPLLLAMCARNGQTVSSVRAVGIDGNGRLSSRSAGGACPGWQIRAGGKTIYYFKEDLSNSGLGDRRLLRFVSSLGRPATFVKSASYLMHSGSFSSIRNYILNDTAGLVQDPSGVPYRYIKEAGWNIKLYGNYQGPIGIFSGNHQSDLVAAYQNRTHPVKPLRFGMGYLLNPQRACLIVARKR